MHSKTRRRILVAIKTDREFSCSPQLSPSETTRLLQEHSYDVYDKEIELIKEIVSEKIKKEYDFQ